MCDRRRTKKVKCGVEISIKVSLKHVLKEQEKLLTYYKVKLLCGLQ